MIMTKIITVILLTFGHQCLLGWGLNNQQSIVDLDDPRNSNDDSHGILNYHTVKPDRRTPIPVPEKITNHIGKPIVPVLQLNPKKAGVKSTQNAGTFITPKPQVYPTLYQKQKSSQETINSGGGDGGSTGNAVVGGSTPRGICDWMSLPNFKNVSLETGELIVRDEEEQPCYLLSLRGYIKWNEDAYFPLSNYQLHPRLQRFILTGRPNDGASARSPYVNCSLLTSDGSTPSSSMRYYPLLKLTIPFKEELLIRVNCGYLVLDIHGDGFHLTLDSLSFYQDPNAIQRRELDKKPKLNEPTKPNISKLPTQIRSDHLVFTSVLADTASPLLMIPLTTRYMCQNRIVLTGNSSVQLVLDRFELQRLAFSSSRNLNLSSSSGITNINSSQSSDFVVPPAGNMRITRSRTMDEREITSSSHSKRSIKRLTRDANVKVNFPSVIRCSNPTNPYEPLASMMDLESTQGLNETLSKMIAERWMPAGSSTMGTIVPPKYGETGFYVMDWIIGFHVLLSLLILILIDSQSSVNSLFS